MMCLVLIILIVELTKENHKKPVTARKIKAPTKGIKVMCFWDQAWEPPLPWNMGSRLCGLLLQGEAGSLPPKERRSLALTGRNSKAYDRKVLPSTVEVSQVISQLSRSWFHWIKTSIHQSNHSLQNYWRIPGDYESDRLKLKKVVFEI